MEEKILREILAVTKENNEILRSLNTHRRWLTFYWFFKWFVILAIAYTAYQAATPYIESAQNAVNSINNFNGQVQDLKSMNQDSFFNYLRNEVEKRIKP
jgi:hypothetical protein